MGKFGIFVAGLMALAGCSQTVDHKGKTPLVEVSHEFLYKEDLQAAMPAGMRGKDSAQFAEEYIHNWIKDVLLYKKAEGNIPDNVKVDELVASYRKALIMHTYQEELVNQQLGNALLSLYPHAHIHTSLCGRELAGGPDAFPPDLRWVSKSWALCSQCCSTQMLKAFHRSGVTAVVNCLEINPSACKRSH